MASVSRNFKSGQLCTGLRRVYRIIRPVSKTHSLCNSWLAVNKVNAKEKFIIKEGHKRSLNTERQILELLKGEIRIRQMVDTISNHESIVLEYAEEDLETLWGARRHAFSRTEIKVIAKQLLEALARLHSENRVHTDLKPEHVLLFNFSRESSSFNVKLCDFGNVSSPSDFPISSHIYRSPESWLGLPWDSATDVWSFGVIIASLMMGPAIRIFSNGDSSMDDDALMVDILQRHVSLFGLYPSSLITKADKQWIEVFGYYAQLPRVCERWRLEALNVGVPEAGISFIERIMKIDARQRPSAQELLQDPYLCD